MLNETVSGAPAGLSEEAASSRLEEEGYNELPSSKKSRVHKAKEARLLR